MNRIITILVTIFILLLLYIWISHVWGGDEPRHPRQIEDVTQNEASDDLMADADTTYTHSSEEAAENPAQEDEYATERKTVVQDDVQNTPIKTLSTEEKKVPVTKTQEPKPEPEAKKTAPPSTSVSKPATTNTKPVNTPVLSSTDGKHLVIAGNFTQLVNAQQRLQELRKAGFSDAEVVNFDLSEYHTVCAGRFSDVNEARRLVKKLKDYHKIDAYVRIGS
jgi:cell division septation protein DedD